MPKVRRITTVIIGEGLKDAIANSNKSVDSLRQGDRDYTYSEIGMMFKELGLVP